LKIDIIELYGILPMTPQEIRKRIDKIKMTAGCEICGYNSHPAALSFDHFNPENKYKTKSGKKVHVADMVKGGRYAWKTIAEEINKCRVLCMNCHMEVTHPRKDLA
jgi:hypothetical protein